MKNISYDQAIEILRNYNTILIDVQTESDYVKKHMINSINIPVEEINQKVNTIKFQYFLKIKVEKTREKTRK